MNMIKSLNEALEIKYRLNEAKEDKEKFIAFINGELKDDIKSNAMANDFDKFKSSGRIKGEEADYYYWIKNKTVKELQDFLSSLNSTNSKTQTKKQEKKGAVKILCPNPNWTIYRIDTYDASKYYGKGTRWCISGNYEGEETRGQYFFDKYQYEEDVRNYYFLWENGKETTEKWCYLEYDYDYSNNPDLNTFFDETDIGYTADEIVDNDLIPMDILRCLPNLNGEFMEIENYKESAIEKAKQTGEYLYEKDNPLNDVDTTDLNEFIANEVCPTKIIVDKGVVCLKDYLFFKCVSVKEIVLPDGLKYIMDSVFENCESLQEINLPDSLKEIGRGAFDNCSSLQEIVIPNGVKEISREIFYGCTSLQEITLPDSIEEIGRDAFYYCISLKEIVIPNSVKEIEDWAFYGCTSLKKISLPDSIEEIGKGAFCLSPLKEITIKGEYRPEIFEDTGLNYDVVFTWVDAGIKERYWDIKKNL